MRVRRPKLSAESIGRVEGELSHLRARRDAVAADVEQTRQAVAGAQKRLASAERAEAAAYLDGGGEDATAERKAAEQAVRDAEEALRRLELVGPELGARIERKQDELAAVLFAEARNESDVASDKLFRATGEWVALLEALPAAAARLRSARDRYDTAHANACELAPDGVEVPTVDEPGWPDTGAAVAMISAGPRRPNADLAAAAAERKRAREAHDDSEIHRAVESSISSGDSIRIRALPTHLQARARERLEAELDRRGIRRGTVTFDGLERPQSGAGI